jgi:hypothetical protein
VHNFFDGSIGVNSTLIYVMRRFVRSSHTRPVIDKLKHRIEHQIKAHRKAFPDVELFGAAKKNTNINSNFFLNISSRINDLFFK